MCCAHFLYFTHFHLFTGVCCMLSLMCGRLVQRGSSLPLMCLAVYLSFTVGWLYRCLEVGGGRRWESGCWVQCGVLDHVWGCTSSRMHENHFGLPSISTLVAPWKVQPVHTGPQETIVTRKSRMPPSPPAYPQRGRAFPKLSSLPPLAPCLAHAVKALPAFPVPHLHIHCEGAPGAP